jgi:hypothetical protein
VLRIGRAQAGFHPHLRPYSLGGRRGRGFGRAGLLLAAVVGIALLIAGTAQAGTVVPAGRSGSQPPQPLGVSGSMPFAHPARMASSPGSVRPAVARPAALATPSPLGSPTATDPATAPPGGGTSTDPWRWWLVGVMVILAGFFLLRGLRRQRGR